MKSEGVIVEQLIRPTGLVDPPLEVRVTANQIDDLLEEIDKRVKDDDKVLVTTITKRMAEDFRNISTGWACATVTSTRTWIRWNASRFWKTCGPECSTCWWA